MGRARGRCRAVVDVNDEAARVGNGGPVTTSRERPVIYSWEGRAGTADSPPEARRETSAVMPAYRAGLVLLLPTAASCGDDGAVEQLGGSRTEPEPPVYVVVDEGAEKSVAQEAEADGFILARSCVSAPDLRAAQSLSLDLGKDDYRVAL